MIELVDNIADISYINNNIRVSAKPSLQTLLADKNGTKNIVLYGNYSHTDFVQICAQLIKYCNDNDVFLLPYGINTTNDLTRYINWDENDQLVPIPVEILRYHALIYDKQNQAN